MNRSNARGGRGHRGSTFNIYYGTIVNSSTARGTGAPGRGGFVARDAGPPDVVLGHSSFPSTTPPYLMHRLEMGTFVHAVEGEMLCSSVNPDKVPWFNAPIYLQNKSMIGKVDEILGPINEMFFSVKMNEGMVAGSFKMGDKVYIAGDKLFPIDRFLPKLRVVGGECWYLSSLSVTNGSTGVTSMVYA